MESKPRAWETNDFYVADRRDGNGTAQQVTTGKILVECDRRDVLLVRTAEQGFAAVTCGRYDARYYEPMPVASLVLSEAEKAWEKWATDRQRGTKDRSLFIAGYNAAVEIGRKGS